MIELVVEDFSTLSLGSCVMRMARVVGVGAGLLRVGRDGVVEVAVGRRRWLSISACVTVWLHV